MTGSMRTFVTDWRTDWRTDGPGYIGPEGGSKKHEYIKFHDWHISTYTYLTHPNMNKTKGQGNKWTKQDKNKTKSEKEDE